MLSKVETEFLRSPEGFDAKYGKVLRHRIREKVQAFTGELQLLQSSGYMQVRGDCNQVTEFRNGEQGLNQAALAKSEVARERFELSSAGPKPAMLVHYTTGLPKCSRLLNQLLDKMFLIKAFRNGALSHITRIKP